MAFEFKLPDIGEGVVEGEIVKWLVKPGDPIAEDQPMVEVMTDKATVVIPSPKAGTVLETRGKEGDIAIVHEVLVVIDADDDIAAPAAEAETATSPTLIPEPVELAPSVVPPAAQSAAPTVSVTPQASGRKVLAAPATRRLARELDVDISIVQGTGPSGRVTFPDVRAYADAKAAAPAAADRVTMVPMAQSIPALASVENEERVPVRGMRKKIWENMARSKSLAAHFTFVEECNCDALVELRKRFNANLGEGEDKLTYLPFILKAVMASLRKFPDLNGHVDEANMEFVRRRDFNLGIAASTERGLIVPVIRHADQYSLIELAQEIRRLGNAARSGTISMDDLGGSTFTITSLGKEGGIFATPIINHPEVAIMGIHKMVKRPVVVDDQIVIRAMMNISLSFDHRLVDGHIGAAFAYSVIRLLESPDRLLMEMA
jgi:pyruvate dehydrogenase E2 component (dihydrolipoamide acetyltransferase)